MSGRDNHEKPDLDAFDLANFIERKSELFIVMGVFGALAIYIAQSADGLGTGTDSELMTTLGFVSAFALSILVLGLIYKELIGEFGDWHTAFRAHFHGRNAPLALFSLFAFVLVISILHLLTRHDPVILILVFTGVYLAGVGVIMRLAYGVARRVPRTPAWRVSTILLACLAAFAGTAYLRGSVLTQFELLTIHELSLTDPVLIGVNVVLLLVETVYSFSAVGALGAVLGALVVGFDKLRGKSPYDG